MADKIGSNAAGRIVRAFHAQLGDFSKAVDLEASVQKIHKKVTHTFINVYFDKDVSKTERSDVCRSMKQKVLDK